MESFQKAELEKKLGYTFADEEIFLRAFRHSSYVNELGDEDVESNERLEFLGDAVLELAVSAILWRRGAGISEGLLTEMRARLVKTDALAELARELELGKLLFLGRGAERNGERENPAILENTFEALIGAIYLDGTAAAAEAVIERLFFERIDAQLAGGRENRDFKSRLQIMLQRRGPVDISYETVAESGPDHNKTFVVRAIVNGKALGEGIGGTKKAAEQAAAEKAIELLKR